MDAYSQIAGQIIKDQEAIIGPIALEQARKVHGLVVEDLDKVKIIGNGKEILSNLVDQYSKLFGRASIEVCKESVHSSKADIAKEDLPEILR